MRDKIRGVGVALVTPFDEEGAVDYNALGSLVERQIEGGVDYLVALGTTAETPTLSDREEELVVECVVKHAKGRVPIVRGVGGYDTRQLVERVKKMNLENISAILSVTPFYNRPSQEGLFQHYKAFAESSPVPIILYNVPTRTGVNLRPETTLRIAKEVKNVLGIKEASGIMGQMATIIAGKPEGFRVISGDDVLTLPLISIGGDGIISVAANAFPKIFSEMVHLAMEGKQKEAVERFYRLHGAMVALFEEGNPAGVKTAMAIKGESTANVRLPLVKGSQQLREKLEKLIEKNNI